MSDYTILLAAAIFLTPLALATLLAAFWAIRRAETDLAVKKKKIDQQIYEVLISREIEERIGYELKSERILETIINSLTKLIPFSTVSYLLLTENPDKVLFRVHLEEVVSRRFIDEVAERMLSRLNEVTGKQFPRENLDEKQTGTIVSEEQKSSPASVWLIPLSINSRAIGVLSVASREPGLYTGEEMKVLEKILFQANKAVNQLEKVLETEQGKLSAMVESLADGVLMLDVEENLVVINPAAQRLLGLDDKHKVTIFDIAEALIDKVAIRTKFETSLRYQRLVVVDELVINDRFYQVLISPVKDSASQVLGGVILFHDFSAQKELDRLRQDFTAKMVHELRAPLTVVRGTADMFREHPDMVGGETGKKLLSNLENSVGSMLNLVNNLLDAAKIEAGEFQVNKMTNRISEVVAEKVDFFQPVAKERLLNLVTDIAPDLPAADFDRERIGQVLTNLISNAMKFTPKEGEIRVQAKKLTTPQDFVPRFKASPAPTFNYPCILVGISDNGIGIPDGKISTLFSKFKEITPAPTGEKGTGLGLSIVKGIVEAHGGKVFAESQAGQGATFYFTLPLPPV